MTISVFSAQARDYSGLSAQEQDRFKTIINKNFNWQSQISQIWLNPQGTSSYESEYQYLYQSLLHQRLQPNPEICTYPARFWLVAQLNGLETDFGHCPDLLHYFARAPVDSINIVYADEDFTSPPSMLGHVFLTLEGRDAAGIVQRNNVSFILPVDKDRPFKTLYLYLLAITTGKRGTVTLLPFQKELEYYTKTEKRNIWQIKLLVEPLNAKLVQLIIWEMKNSPIKYNFFSYNCATFVEFLVSLTHDDNRTSFFYTTPMKIIKQANDNHQIAEINLFPNELWKNRLKGIDQMTDSVAPFNYKSDSYGSIGFGRDQNHSQIRLGFKAVAHEIIDRPRIFSHGSEVILGAVRILYNIDKNSAKIDELTILRITDYSPVNDYHRPSYSVHVGANHEFDKDFTSFLAFNQQVLVGVTVPLGDDIDLHALTGARFLQAKNRSAAAFVTNIGITVNQIFDTRSALDYRIVNYDSGMAKRQSFEYQLSYNGWENSALSLGVDYIQTEIKQTTSFSLDYKIYF